MVVSRSLALTSFDDARPSPLCGPSSTIRCRCTRLMCIPTYCLNCYCYYLVCILCAWRSAATLTNEVEKPSTPNRHTHTQVGGMANEKFQRNEDIRNCGVCTRTPSIYAIRCTLNMDICHLAECRLRNELATNGKCCKWKSFAATLTFASYLNNTSISITFNCRTY